MKITQCAKCKMRYYRGKKKKLNESKHGKQQFYGVYYGDGAN